MVHWLCLLFSDIGERRQMLGSVSAKERSTPGLTSWGRKSPTLDRAMGNARSCAKLTSSMSQLSTSGKAPYLDTLVVGIALLGLCWSRCGLSPINLLLTMVGHQISEWNPEGAHPTLIPVEFHPSYQPGAISKVDNNFLAKLCLNILLDMFQLKQQQLVCVLKFVVRGCISYGRVGPSWWHRL